MSTGDLNATCAATLVDEWASAGVTDAVVCPGLWSTPLAVALAREERISVHVHHDERSGAFMALGWEWPCADRPSCSPHRAPPPRNCTQLVVEAHHAAVPLLL